MLKARSIAIKNLTQVAPLTHQHYQDGAIQVMTNHLTPGKFIHIHIKGKKQNTKT